MPLDPQAADLLAALAAAGGPPIVEAEVPAVREAMAALGAMSVPEDVREVTDAVVPGPAGDLPVRIYTPELAGEAPQPALVWFHGGGFVIGDLDIADGTCRALCRRAGVVVVSVDYRLAPEHAYPAAVEDALAAFDWVRDHAADLRVAPEHLAVGGDSAGGNLAAVVALQRRDDVAFQLLVYPTVDLRGVAEAAADHPSLDENAEGYLLTRDHMAWFTGHYFGDGLDAGSARRTEPLASPLLVDDLAGAPPAFVLTAEFDPLRDEGEAYAARLRDAGVAVAATRYDGMIHAFFQLNAVIAAADVAVDDAAAALREALV